MAEAEVLWEMLRESANPSIAALLKSIVETGSDRDLHRINPLAFAAAHGVREEDVVDVLVHSARLGLFDMSWNVLCPGCGGVLETGVALKTLKRPEYLCSLCVQNFEPTLDELVEVTFTVNPRVRRIAGHDPDQLPFNDYMSEIFLGSGVELPPNMDELVERFTLDVLEIAPGEKAATSLTLPRGFLIVFDPVTHTTLFLNCEGEEAHQRRNVSVVFSDSHAHSGILPLQPGPVRLNYENRSNRRAVAAVLIADDTMKQALAKRRPFLTGAMLLGSQTFRDLYRTGTLDPDQRLKITSLTILFTDLRGSTALYDRVGDIVAYDMVRGHFAALLKTVAAEGGAVVKTIGDAVMATFSTPEKAIRAAVRMREAMRELNAARPGEELALNIGLHEGPCLAVMLDERQDYFGQTVNVASRVQGLADPSAILATKPVVESGKVRTMLDEAGFVATPREISLRGVTEAVTVYEIKDGARQKDIARAPA
jgi:class 3 adenylate cyclase